MNNKFSYFCCAVLMLFLNSCGDSSPDLTGRDVAKLQREENMVLRSDELIPILGTYSGAPQNNTGLYLIREDRWLSFELVLTMHNVSVGDTGTIDSIVVPELSGSARQWIEGTGVYTELEVESGSYNPQTRRIYLKFKNASVSLEGYFINDEVHANWNSSLRGDIAGRVSVKKVD